MLQDLQYDIISGGQHTNIGQCAFTIYCHNSFPEVTEQQ